MRVRALSALAALATVAVVGCVPPPPPAHVLDQVNAGSQMSTGDVVMRWTCDDVVSYTDLAQTFAAGVTGTIDQVSLAFTRFSPGPPLGLAVSIRTLDPTGAPTDTVLGSGTYVGVGREDAFMGAFTEIPLTQPAPVVAGQAYSIVLSAPPTVSCGGGPSWYFVGDGDSYTGGQLWIRTNYYGYHPDWEPSPDPRDVFFRTWVASD